MTKKSQFRLTLLAGLLLVVLAVISFWEPVQNILQTRSETPFQQVKQEDITEITISRGKEMVSLVKENDSWYIKNENNTVKADNTRIDALLNSFNGVRKVNIISANKNRHEEFGINADTFIAFKSGRNEHKILLGNQSRASSNYAIVDSTDNVYSIAGFNAVFDPIDYRDTNIGLISEPEKLSKIEIQNKKISYILTKNENDWVMDTTELDNDKVNQFINDLETLRGEAIVDELPENIINTNPVLTISVVESGNDTSISIWEEIGENKTYYAKVNDNENVYIMNEFIVNLITKEGSEFRASEE